MGPKTAKVYDTLRERVVSGEYAPGDKLPSERTLAEQLDVGRTALRQVLGRLVSEGIIERHQRSAYRVPRTMLEGSVQVPGELLEELRDRHGLTDEGLRFALERAQVRLVPVDGEWWSIDYRVSLD
ncbi:winged helix-turn-helix domain-containing protein [Streptomyces hawaiiensis]|uniref:winged helix-turn-helix domain-containing protein n=1 Tax=Streptomyces hawaiiensis TaxID=67305 RepID=UPI003650CBD5